MKAPYQSRKRPVETDQNNTIMNIVDDRKVAMTK
jgi:hypothetical protein